MNYNAQEAGGLTEKIKLVQAAVDDIQIGEPASYDMLDGAGRLLLAKGMPISQSIWKMLESRQVYTISRRRLQQLPRQFSCRLRDRAVEIIERLYCNAPILGAEQLQEVAVVVDTLLAELEQNPSSYVDLQCLKRHDDFTYLHSVNVAILAAIIGKGMGFDRQALRRLTLGAILHDFGKMKIPQQILNKQGRLTEAEYKIVRQHPSWGEQALAPEGVSQPVLAAVRQHHERWNGTGYPDRLSGEAIHINAQIAAVADVFEAITADRPYHSGMPAYHAVELIISGEGADFSPTVVQAFLENVIIFPPNALVTLNTGERGVVIDVPHRFPTRPRLRILYDAQGKRCSAYVLDMLETLNVFITSVAFEADLSP